MRRLGLDDVDIAAILLNDGLIVAIPTDTVYGLAARLGDPQALDALYVAKGRPETKPLPVLVGDPSAISGLLGDYGMGAYNASKAAVINYTRSLALDCSRIGIRVNALCPGAIAGTQMAVGEHGGDEYRQSWLDTIPMGRFGTAEEMAGVATFLASPDASYMTGAIVAADGGSTAHTGQLDFPGRRRKREAGLA